jgi:hypothetical protein
VTALLRYQSALLLRSHRWIFPLIAYGLLIAVGAAGSTSLAETLDWSGAMLVPVVAFLTRASLTAEPDAARACVAAATSPARAQLATLLAPLAGGAILGLAAAAFGLLTAEPASKAANPAGAVTDKLSDAAQHPGIVVAGLLIMLICLLVGSAIGALFNAPLLRHPGAAMMATLAAAIVALVTDVSPAAAALAHTAAAASNPTAANWPGPVSLAGAALLLLATWALSLRAAAFRDTRAPTVS